MTRLRAPRRSFLFREPVKNILIFIGIVLLCLLSVAGKSQVEISRSEKISQLHTLFKKDRDVVHKVENYAAENFLRNDFFIKYVEQKAIHLNQRDKDILAIELLEVFRASQKELFNAGYADPKNVDHLIADHKSTFLSNLDSYYLSALKKLTGTNKRGKKPIEQLLEQPTHCENMDMEACDFSNWEIANGRVNNVPYGFVNRTVTTIFGQGVPVDDGLQHSILSIQQQDPVVPIPVVKAGGTCSAVLGDRLGDGYLAASMTRQFQVTAENYFFTYSYAVIMEDPTNVHTPGERPYFTVRLWDENGAAIGCGDYEVYSGDGNPAWINSPNTPTGTPIVYTNWTDALIPLQNYIGQTITIEFATGDCNLGGHAAYAYVEANCGGEILVTDTFTCPGVPVTLTAPDGASSYTWSTGETTQQIVTSDSGTYTVVMGGTADNSCTTQLSKRIHLKTPPIGDFTADTVCLNEATTFVDRSSPATTGIAAWRWDTDNDGAFEGTGQAYSFTFATPGEHTVTLQVEDDNGCLDDTTFTILINELPTADFSAPSVCLGDSSLLTNAATNYATLIWDVLNDGSVLRNDSDVTYLYGQSGAQTVKLTAETAEGCTDEITKDIVINPNPNASFSHQEVCFPGAVNFSDASSISTGQVVDWFWDFGDSSVADDTSNTRNSAYSHQSYAQYDVMLIVTSDSGCVDTATNPVSYFEKPAVDFAVERACQNEEFQFTNSSTVASSSFVGWNWDVENNGIINYLTAEATHVFTQAGPDSVKLIGITADGCRDTIVKEVYVDTLPIADFVALPVCFGQTSALMDNSQGTIVSWDWDLYSDNVSDGFNADISHTFISEGVHQVKLSVVTNRGCRDSVEKTVLVNPLPLADFALDSVCAPLENTFTDASSVSSGNVVAFEWTFGDGSANSDAQNTSHLYSVYGGYDVQLKVTTDSSCVDSITKRAVVFEKPVVHFTIGDICQNEFASLNNMSPTFSGTFEKWSWDVGVNGTIEYTTTDASHVFNAEGVDSVMLIGESTNGCLDSLVNGITVHPLPTAFFEIPNECFGSEVSFEDKSVGDIVEWNWDVSSDGSVEYTSQSPTHVFEGTGVETVELMVETDEGCRDSLELTTETYPLPVAAFTAPGVCETFESTFVSESSIASGSIVGYEWNFGDSTVAENQTTATNTYNTSGQYQASLLVVSDQGCRDSVSLIHTVFAPPIADFNFSNACLHTAIEMSGAANPANLSYSWDVNADGQQDYAQNLVSHFYASSGEKTVELMVVDAEGCADTIAKVVEVYSLPTADFQVDNVCFGASNEFEDYSNDPQNEIVSWTWDHEENGFVDNSSQNSTYFLSRVGNYSNSLVVENDKGCRDTVSKEVSVYPIPVVDFNPTEVCYNEETTFSNLSTVEIVEGQNNNLPTHLWLFAANDVTSIESPVKTFNEDGSFNVQLIVTSNNGCTDSTTKVVSVNPLPEVEMTSSLPEGCTTWCVDFEDDSKLNQVKLTSIIGVLKTGGSNWGLRFQRVL